MATRTDLGLDTALPKGMRVMAGQEPETFLGRFDPKGRLHWIAVGGKPLDEPATVIDLVFYQRALIHGNTPLSMASYRSVASYSVLPIP